MRLRRADVSMPGMSRRRRGKGWSYHDTTTGLRVVEPAVVARCDALVLPPAWTDVWICPWPNGHIQAVGTDARGRRQYRYHDAWCLRQDTVKFDRVLRFAQRLPSIRAAADTHLATDGLTSERVLSGAVRLLDVGFFRIGGEGYAEENQSYGLATIRKDHVKVKGDEVVFDYVAKGGKQRIQSVIDPDLVRLVGELKSRRGGGAELLAWRDGGGAWSDVRSADINAFLRQLAGMECSAKDFRTWGGTVLAAIALAVSLEVRTTKTARKRAVARMYAEVADYLGNTPAVCRSSYVDPRVVDRYRAGATIAPALDRLASGAPAGEGMRSMQGAIEAAVIALLDEAPAVTVAEATAA